MVMLKRLFRAAILLACLVPVLGIAITTGDLAEALV
jgi:hypothetical protein